jgi:Effector Associated Constant Component 1
MDAQIRITGGTGGELAALGEWLGGEDELRGRVRTVHGPVGETELGAIAELLTVALGAGGAGTVLASSLKTWLVTRRTTAKITVESAGRSVTLDIQTVGEVAPFLDQILRVGDDAGDDH